MSDELPILQESQLGWLVAGSINTELAVPTVNVYQASINDRKDEQLKIDLERFWMIDEQISEPLSDDCEKHFRASYSRRDDGRYVVQLPFREDADQLGDSRAQAERKFKALEDRLEKHPDLKKMYSDFVNEYLELGHAMPQKPNQAMDTTYRIIAYSNQKAQRRDCG